MSTDQIKQAKNIAQKRDSKRRDMFVNAYSGFGGTKDPMTRIAYSAGTVLTRSELEALYRFNWVARRIIEAIPEDAVREWIEITTDDKDLVTNLNGRMETLKVQGKIKEALINARMYGGAVIIIGAIDGGSPEKPLNEDKIKSINFLNVLDRWQLQIDKTYTDPLQTNFGEPELYRLQAITLGSSNPNQKIHESRVLRFDGDYIPEILKVMNSGWYDSILTSINEELKRHGTSIQAGAALIQDFVTKVLKIPDLVDLIANDDSEAINTRIQYAISTMSLLGITLIGEDEEFSKIQTPIAGLVDLIDRYIELIAAAGKTPKARLFGQSLGVLAGATETTRAYYDSVGAYQNDHLKDNLEKLIRIFFKDQSAPNKGIEPEEWSFKFNSLWQPSQKETVETRKMQAETDKLYVDMGDISPAEISASRFGADGYSIETVLDLVLRAEYKRLAEEEAEELKRMEEEEAREKELGLGGEEGGE